MFASGADAPATRRGRRRAAVQSAPPAPSRASCHIAVQTPELRRSQPPSIALDGLLLALLFFEPIGELELVEVDQATSLDGLVAAVLVEREPVHLALGGVDDHQLVDVVGGVEGQLLPAVLVGRDDLDDQLDAGQRRAPSSSWASCSASPKLHSPIATVIPALRAGGLSSSPSLARLGARGSRARRDALQRHLPRRPIREAAPTPRTQESARCRQTLDHRRCWHMLTTGELYNDLGGDYFAAATPRRPPSGSSPTRTARPHRHAQRRHRRLNPQPGRHSPERLVATPTLFSCQRSGCWNASPPSQGGRSRSGPLREPHGWAQARIRRFRRWHARGHRGGAAGVGCALHGTAQRPGRPDPRPDALGGDRHGRHRGDRLRAHSTQRAGRKSARDVDCGLSVAAANAEPWRWAPRTRHR